MQGQWQDRQHMQTASTRAVLPQGNRAMQRVFFYAQWSFDCYLIQVLEGQCHYSTGLANMRSDICCSHLLSKSKLNGKLKINNGQHHGACVLKQGTRSSKVVDFDTNRKRNWDLLLFLNSKLGPVLPRFRDIRIRALVHREPHFPYPTPIPAKI